MTDSLQQHNMSTSLTPRKRTHDEMNQIKQSISSDTLASLQSCRRACSACGHIDQASETLSENTKLMLIGELTVCKMQQQQTIIDLKQQIDDLQETAEILTRKLQQRCRAYNVLHQEYEELQCIANLPHYDPLPYEEMHNEASDSDDNEIAAAINAMRSEHNEPNHDVKSQRICHLKNDTQTGKDYLMEQMKDQESDDSDCSSVFDCSDIEHNISDGTLDSPDGPEC